MKYENDISPPKWADRFLRFYCRDEFLEEIQGDVHEIFEVNQEQRGAGYAKRRFVWDVFRFLRWSNIKTFKKVQFNSISMYQNYLKIAWRGLNRSKLYSIINISGLAVAMAVFMLIFLYVRHETSYDKYHSKADQIYRVASHLTVPGSYFEFAIAPPNLGKRMVQDFPEVLDQMRMARFQGTLKHQDKAFVEYNAVYADHNFFEFFDIPMLEGSTSEALKSPYSIVMTENTALKYFGTTDALGKVINITGIDQPFSVTGVMSNIPDNTHFGMDFLVSMETYRSRGILQDDGQWFFISYWTYLLFPEDMNPDQLQARMPDFIERNIGEEQRRVKQTYQFKFQRLTDIHLKSHLDGEIQANGDIQYVYIFSIIAIFIVVIACVNFMNLSTSRASKRAKEIGMRKVVGAVKRQLVIQFLTESTLISFLAFLISMGLVVWILPEFNVLVDKQLSFESLFTGEYVALWPGLILVIGLLAGLYPAFVLSSFKPVNILKASSSTGQQNTLLKQVLVIFQLVVSTVLIIGTLVINQQLKSMQNQNLGFDQEQLFVLNATGDGSVADQMEVIRSTFKANPSVSEVSFSRSSPAVNGAGNWYSEYEVADGEMQNASLYGYLVDHDFINTYGLSMVTGRNFSREMATDFDKAFIVNETTVEKMGLTDPSDAIGRKFYQFGKEGEVIGVVQNFNFESLHNAIEPLVIQLSRPQNLGILSVRLNSGADLSVLDDLKETWEGMVEAVPFDVSFADQALNNQYQAEIRTRKILSTFSSLAIFIAALGLFALATLNAEQQKRSISIRKVLGAPEAQIAYRFSLSFLKLTGLALLISIPIAYFASESWLSNFNYRMDMDPLVFVIGGVITSVITLLTVSFQSFKLTRINPAQNLRSE